MPLEFVTSLATNTHTCYRRNSSLRTKDGYISANALILA